MARRCTTVPGYGACCAAAQQGKLNQPVVMTDSRGHKRCLTCSVITKRNGSPGFRARFQRNAACGIGPGGCPALASAGGGGGQPTLQLPGY